MFLSDWYPHPNGKKVISPGEIQSQQILLCHSIHVTCNYESICRSPSQCKDLVAMYVRIASLSGFQSYTFWYFRHHRMGFSAEEWEKGVSTMKRRFQFYAKMNPKVLVCPKRQCFRQQPLFYFFVLQCAQSVRNDAQINPFKANKNNLQLSSVWHATWL